MWAGCLLNMGSQVDMFWYGTMQWVTWPRYVCSIFGNYVRQLIRIH
jgi:hypothetical protein